MRSKIVVLCSLTAIGILILSGCTGFVPPAGGGLDKVPPGASKPSGAIGRYLVVFEDKTIPSGAKAAIAELGGEVIKEFPEIGVLVVASNDPDFPAKAREIEEVEEVGPDEIWILPEPKHLKPLEELHNPTGSGDYYYDLLQWDIKRVGGTPETWAIETGDDVVVAVLDTGVYGAHPDLVDNYLYGKSFVDTSVPLPPYISVPPEEDGSPQDYVGHGTHVAGAIAAMIDTNPSGFAGGGVTGVAPEAGIVNYKVLMLVYVDPDPTIPGDEYYSGIGFTSWIVAAIIDAADSDVDVINMSLGGTDLFTDPEDLADFISFARATQYAWEKGVLVVTAAGNEVWDPANNPWKNAPSMAPAALAVVSTGGDDLLASYSNYGAFNADFTAPGGDWPPFDPINWWLDLCASTWSPLSVDLPAYYVWAIGTSMAAPKVSGVAALIYAQNPGISPTEVVRILERTSEDLGAPGYDLTYGWGMVNAYRAVTE